MMARFYGYLDKVFQFRDLTARLTDSRREPLIPTAAIFGTAFAMFATGRQASVGAGLRQLPPLFRCRGRRWPVSGSSLHQFLPGTP